MADLSDDDCWSAETYSLAEVPDKVELPTLVRVTEGIYSTQDCSTFSQGDIIRIDGCETIEMVGAHLALLGNGCFRPQGKELYVPLNYKGRVRVCSVHGNCQQYNSVDDLITYFPKFVKVYERLSFTNNKGQTFVLEANATIELLKIIGIRGTGATALRMRQNNTEIILPRSLKALFVDVDFTIADVMKFKMPLSIKFLGQDIHLFTSKDIQEAAANIDHYDGYLQLSGERKNRVVLVGHYKSLEKDPSSKFCRRSAVVLPMDNPEISGIQVQIPTYMDTADYEVFVLKHFSERDVCQSVDGLLYIEFSKNPSVTFLKDPSTKPPVVPPRSDIRTSSSEAPPRPPKPGELPKRQNKRTDLKQSVELPHPTPLDKHSVAANVHVLHSSTEAASRDIKTPTHIVTPVQREKDVSEVDDASPFLLADLSFSFGEGNDTIDEEYSGSQVNYENCSSVRKKHLTGKAFLKKIKQKFVPKPQKDAKEEDGRRQEESKQEDYVEPIASEAIYDYVDESSMISIHARHALETSQAEDSRKARTAVVQPFQQAEKEQPEKKFKNLSVDELQTCFVRCALEHLAQIVSSQRLDGEMFSSLTDDDLKKDPMFLNNLDIKKVRQIQKGWRPNI